EQLAVDLRANRDGVERTRSADAVKVDRNIGNLRRNREHRNRLARRGAGRAALALALLVNDGLLRRTLPRCPIINDACREGQANEAKGDTSGPGHQLAFIAPFLSGGIQAPPNAWYRLSTACSRARRTTTS